MKIILDTNIIVADYRMTNPSFQVLLESSKNESIQLIIPQIVLEETINKFTERLKLALSTTDREIKTLNKITGNNYPMPLSEEILEVETERYEAYLNEIIATNKINVLPYPETKHSIIAKRAMNKVKPFNSNGAGYRDTLIWENIKELLTRDQEIPFLPELLFISKDSDFTTQDSQLHSDLINELEDELFNPESLQIFLSVNEYVDKIGKINLEQIVRLEKKLKAKEFDYFDLETITSEYLFENFIGAEIEKYHIDIPNCYDEPCVKSISEDYKIEEISVKKVSASKILIEVTFECEVYLEFFIDKMEYYGMDEADRPSLIESDWNDHVMWAETDKILTISMSIIVNPEMDVLSCEITKINNNYAHYYDMAND
jgi:predicted nucleic acid-binding protein